MMHKPISWLALLAVGLAGAACQSQEQKQTEPARTTTARGTTQAPPAAVEMHRGLALVRVMQARPGTQTIDIFAGDDRLFTSVAYKTVTPYKEIADQRYTFRLRPSGRDSSEPLAENSEGLSAGQHYTIVVMPGEKELARLDVLNDDLVPPAEGKAKVRVVNASPDTSKLDVTAKGQKDPLFDDVAAQTAKGYDEIKPVSGAIEIREKDGKRVLTAVPKANLESGKMYTILVVGREAGSPKLEAMTVEDEVQIGAEADAPRPIVPEKDRDHP